jgi:hypothetical protein
LVEEVALALASSACDADDSDWGGDGVKEVESVIGDFKLFRVWVPPDEF